VPAPWPTELRHHTGFRASLRTGKHAPGSDLADDREPAAAMRPLLNDYRAPCQSAPSTIRRSRTTAPSSTASARW
jgi:hypothetical protein